MRFIVILDPDDQWLVFDQFTNLPAEVGNRVLMGLSREEAEELADDVNTQEPLVA